MSHNKKKPQNDGASLEEELRKLRNEMFSSVSNVGITKQQLEDTRRDACNRTAAFIENELEKSCVVQENKKLTEIADRNKKLLEDKTKQYKDLISELQRQLKDKEDALEWTNGRLEESRKAKNALHDQLKNLEKGHFAETIKFRGKIKENEEEIIELRLEKDRLKLDCEKLANLLETRQESDEELQAYQDEMANLEEILKEKEIKVEKLESEKEKLEQALQKYENENAQVRKQLAKYVDQCKNKMESEDSAQNVIKEQLTQLQKQCENLKAQLSDANSKKLQMETELEELRRNNGLLKVDVRILTRGKSTLENKLSEKQTRCEELESKLASLESGHASTNQQLRSLEETIESLKKDVDTKESKLSTLASIKDKLNEKKSELDAENCKLKKQLEQLQVQVRNADSSKELLTIKEDIIKEKISEMALKESKIRDLEKNVKMLVGALKKVEEDNKVYFELIQSQKSDVEALQKLRDMLDTENKDIREQLRQTKMALNEAKSLKAFTEKRLENTESDLKSETKLKNSEVQAIREKLAVASSRNEDLCQELTTLMNKISALEGEKFELRKEVESVKGDKERVTVELNRCIKTLVDTKEELLSLKEAFKENLVKGEGYKHKLESVQEELSAMKETSRIQELKLTTINQQQKNVIDELLEQVPKKKKGNIFTPKRLERDAGTPAKYGTPATPVLSQRARLLEQKNKVYPETVVPNRQKQLFEGNCYAQAQNALKIMERTTKLLEAEEKWNGGTPLTKKMPTLPIRIREENVLLKERCKTISTPPTKIVTGKSHKLNPTRCESIKKCMTCWEPIYTASPMSTCEKCGYDFHLACSLTAGETCGLSENKAYEIQKDTSSKRGEPIHNGVDNDVRGFVKVRSEKMAKAETRFLVMEDSLLKMYLRETDRKVAKPVAKYPINEKTTVSVRIDKEANQSSFKEQAVFAMKVTFYDDQGNSAYLYMFHTNKRHKRYWTHAIVQSSKMCGSESSSLDKTGNFSEFSYGGDDDKENRLVKINEHVIFKETESTDKLYVNCAYYLESSKTYLLGCEDGLYSVKDVNGKLVKIPGPNDVHEITVLDGVKLALLIEGPNRVLTSVYSGLLKSCAQAAPCSNAKLETQVVPKTTDCYMIATRGTTIEDTAVAVACSKTLLFLAMMGGELTVLRVINVEGITSLLMTPHSILYGSDNVREIDTKTFENEEFLDMTDDSIYYVQIINESNGSYPVAILDVTRTRGENTKEKEYLICFQDIGIFVDEYGRRSRDGDVLWSQVPLAFQYQHPFLYVVHFMSVEVQKLDAKSYTRVKAASHSLEEAVKSRSESKVNMPEIRFLPVNSKSSPSRVGQGAQGVIIALHEAQAIKIVELTAS